MFKLYCQRHRLYVDNETDKTLKNICFTFGGIKGTDISIKKLYAKPKGAKFSREIFSILNFHMAGTRPFIMYYYDNNNVKREHIIVEKMNSDFSSNPRVEVVAVNEDGSLKIKVEENYES